MTLTELARTIKQKGLMSVSPLILIGQAKPVIEFLALLNDTVDFAPSDDYWETIAEYRSLLGGYCAVSY